MALKLCGTRRGAEYLVSSSTFDSVWRHRGLLATLIDDAIFQKHRHDVPIIFIQDANNISDSQLVVDEQVADSHFSLGFWVENSGIGRNSKPRLSEWETVTTVSH